MLGHIARARSCLGVARRHREAREPDCRTAGVAAVSEPRCRCWEVSRAEICLSVQPVKIDKFCLEAAVLTVISSLLRIQYAAWSGAVELNTPFQPGGELLARAATNNDDIPEALDGMAQSLILAHG